MSFTDPLKANRGALTQYRCNVCREWHEGRGACPTCGKEPPAYNEGLRAAKMNSALWAQAAKK